MKRSYATAWALIYVVAVLLALAAGFVFLRHPGLSAAAWILVGAALLVCLAGLLLQVATASDFEALNDAQSQVELLEARLAQQQSAVDQLGDGLEIALFICDRKANVQYANRAAQALFSFGDSAPKSLLAVTLSAEMERILTRAFAKRKSQTSELRFTGPPERVGIVKAWPQEHSDRMFVSILDVTELRRLERVRRDFVSNVSHELRTPLTIIRSMAETLLDNAEILPAKREQYLAKMVSEVDRLALMSNDLLVLTSAESRPVSKRPSDLAEVFRSVVEQLQAKSEAKQVELRFEGPRSLIVPSDPEQIRQVALNLVENALNHTNEGCVTIAVRQDGENFLASVSDTGTGIGSEDLPKIFERFYRVDRGRARETGGTGLGLSIVKHIAEAHGGSIDVSSSLNVGTTFTVRLPMEESRESNDA